MVSILQRLKMADDRRQVAAALTVAFIALALVAAAVWLPAARRHRAVLRQAAESELQLRRKFANFSESKARERLAAEQKRAALWRSEWETFASCAESLRTVAQREEFVANEGQAGHIDFKVALYNARQKVGERAKAKNVAIPADLGMDEAVGEKADPLLLIRQLAAVVKLVDVLVDLGLPQVARIEVLPPVVLPAAGDEGQQVTELPVRVVATGTYAGFSELLQKVSAPEHFFALRHFRLQKKAMEAGDNLEIEAVFSAFVLGKKAAEPAAKPAPGEEPPAR